MYYKKNFSIYDSTFPFVWVCVLTWWVDRLFVELGHRSTDSLVCIHNNLQYIHYHQYITTFLLTMQVSKAVSKRRRQFLRESKLATAITGVANTVVIAILQMILVFAWTCIVSVLLDVSPWLCIPYFLENRAIISLVAFVCILTLLPLESIFWDWSIQKGLEVQLI